MPNPMPYNRNAHRAEVTADRVGTAEKRQRAKARVEELTAAGTDRKSLRLAWQSLRLLAKMERVEAELENALKRKP